MEILTYKLLLFDRSGTSIDFVRTDEFWKQFVDLLNEEFPFIGWCTLPGGGASAIIISDLHGPNPNAAPEEYEIQIKPYSTIPVKPLYAICSLTIPGSGNHVYSRDDMFKGIIDVIDDLFPTGGDGAITQSAFVAGGDEALVNDMENHYLLVHINENWYDLTEEKAQQWNKFISKIQFSLQIHRSDRSEFGLIIFPLKDNASIRKKLCDAAASIYDDAYALTFLSLEYYH